MIRQTHTYALMVVPSEFHALVKAKLEEAGYDQAIQVEDGQVVLDMHGIALISAYVYSEEDCPGHIASANSKICARCGTHVDSLRPEPE